LTAYFFNIYYAKNDLGTKNVILPYDKMVIKKVPKSSDVYTCDYCDYSTSRHSQYERHIMTSKHKMITSAPTVVTGGLFYSSSDDWYLYYRQ
jgi:hypothetical protein